MNVQKRGPLGFILGFVFMLTMSAGTAFAAVENCTDGIDNDGDKLIDCADTKDCGTNPACVKIGTGCSPGFYKNHVDTWFGQSGCCTDASDPSCTDILNALVCKGADATCGRSAAAAILDACTGCSE